MTISSNTNSTTDVAVEVRNVTKRFKLFNNIASGPLKDLLFFWRKGQYYEEFLAVDDVSFSIKKGEIVGIIGPNGAGKTTLLRMIAGLLPYNQGSIETTGKVTALLAMGVGVHPEFTGRQNIYYNGVMLGLSKRQIEEKTPGIIEFSELGEYIDHPFRTYSAGMRARLLFSIAITVEPDILIVDEALAAGDAYFIEKCHLRILELCASGATILFVSHNLRQIEEFCSRGIVIREGRVVYDGPVQKAVDLYVDQVHEETTEKLLERMHLDSQSREVAGTGEIGVTDAYFMVDGKRTPTLTIFHDCELHMELDVQMDLDEVVYCVELHSSKSSTAFAFLSVLTLDDIVAGVGPEKSLSLKKGKSKIVMRIPNLPLGDAEYKCNIEFFSNSKDHVFTLDTCYCYYRNFFEFHAIYENKRNFGRGTLGEVPVSSVELIHLED